jgi:hypothetical protein
MNSLIQPIFVNEDGEQSKDCTLIAFWKMIFSYLELPPEHQLQLRWLCHIFYEALPPIIWTSFSEHILTLNHLLNSMNIAHQQNPSKAPTILFLQNGVHKLEEMEKGIHPIIIMNYSISIIGEGNIEGEEGTKIIGGIIGAKNVNISIHQCMYENLDELTIIKQKEFEKEYVSNEIDYDWLEEANLKWENESENGEEHDRDIHPQSELQYEFEVAWCERATEWYELTGCEFEDYDADDPDVHQDVGVLFDLIC